MSNPAATLSAENIGSYLKESFVTGLLAEAANLGSTFAFEAAIGPTILTGGLAFAIALTKKVADTVFSEGYKYLPENVTDNIPTLLTHQYAIKAYDLALYAALGYAAFLAAPAIGVALAVHEVQSIVLLTAAVSVI